MRTTATQLAYDMVERMRSNPAGVDAGYYVIASSDPVMASGDSCEGIPCSAAQMASYDIARWRDATRSLPGGTSSIATTITGTVVTHTITVYWDEYHRGITGTDCGPDPDVDLRCMSLIL